MSYLRLIYIWHAFIRSTICRAFKTYTGVCFFFFKPTTLQGLCLDSWANSTRSALQYRRWNQDRRKSLWHVFGNSVCSWHVHLHVLCVCCFPSHPATLNHWPLSFTENTPFVLLFFHISVNCCDGEAGSGLCVFVCVRKADSAGVLRVVVIFLSLSLLCETSVLGRLVISVRGGGVRGSAGCIRKTKRTASIMCPLYPVH